jgi:glycosyltransferase involved in cell wall biosynthesis
LTEENKNIENERTPNVPEGGENTPNSKPQQRRRRVPKPHHKGRERVEDVATPAQKEKEKPEQKDKQKQGQREDRTKNSGGANANDSTKRALNKGKDKNRRESGNRPLISVVIPTYNEEGSLRELSEGLEKVLARETNNNYEVLFIDDGSTDGSFSVIKEINSKNSRFKAIRFRRNYGKSAALAVGFQRARGAVLITMDADLQDDPTEIPNLMAKIREGYDLVSGWKKKRNDPINKTLPSKFFNYVTGKASGIKLHDFNCGLKAYRAEVAHSLDIYGEMHRYLPVLAHWNGFRITEIPVKHHARKHGKTKFGASRYVKGFLDLLTLLFTSRYMKRPLHLFGTVGAMMGLIGFAIDAWLTVEWIMGNTFLSNRPMALLGIALIIVGVQLVSLGLLGEMIVKNFKRDEEYQIRENL